MAQTMVLVLRQCGNELTRENVMKQAANLRDQAVSGLLPGIKLNTSATDYAPLSQLQLMRPTGDSWQPFGEIMDADVNVTAKSN
jgi:branched-chain amino acid transport system substrate-binding protein